MVFYILIKVITNESKIMNIIKNIYIKIINFVYNKNHKNNIEEPLELIFSFGNLIENSVTSNDTKQHITIEALKEYAMNKKSTSWWLENPEARVVELELVEKKS